MFTGIIEHQGTVASLKSTPDGGRLKLHAPTVAKHLEVSKSIAVNGCCLTVVEVDAEHFSADLSGETLRKTSLGDWKTGTRVNLEQPLTAGKEFGGHFVLGHVDTIGRVARLAPKAKTGGTASKSLNPSPATSSRKAPSPSTASASPSPAGTLASPKSQ